MVSTDIMKSMSFCPKKKNATEFEHPWQKQNLLFAFIVRGGIRYMFIYLLPSFCPFLGGSIGGKVTGVLSDPLPVGTGGGAPAAARSDIDGLPAEVERPVVVSYIKFQANQIKIQANQPNAIYNCNSIPFPPNHAKHSKKNSIFHHSKKSKS